MRNKRSRLLAAVLAVGLLALPVRADVTGGKLDLDRTCSLTVVPGNFGDSETEAGYEADFKEAGVVVDLYKVADAVAEPGYGTYSYGFLGGYAALASSGALNQDNLVQMTNQDWLSLARQAAEATLEETRGPDGKMVTAVKDSVKAQAVLTGVSLGTKSDLGSGLYLVIARGANDAGYMQYMDVPGEGTDGSGEGIKQLVTIATSRQYTYSFFPELISLPSTREVVTEVLDGEGNRQEITTDGGAWQYGLTAELKHSRDIRNGSLEIVKSVLTYENSEPVTFVFRVDAYKDSTKAEKIFSDVVSITFDAAGQRSAVVDNIPARSYVEVTEIYSGAAYELTTQELQSTEIVAGGTPQQVNFGNTYNNSGNGGGAITNRFDYGEDGTWHWTEIPEISVTPAQGNE